MQSTVTPTDALVIDGAARFHEHSEYGGYPTGRITGAWLPAPGAAIRGSLGAGVRAPFNYELYGPCGDADLEPDSSVSADLSLAYRFAVDRAVASALAFRLEIDDLIQFGETVYVQNDGTATCRGVEFGASWEIVSAAVGTGADTYTDTEGVDGQAHNRIPRHDLALARTTVVAERISYDVNASFVWGLVDRSVQESDGFAKDYVVVNARRAYAVAEDTEVYVRAANLLAVSHRPRIATSDPAFFAGVAARF